MAGPSDKGNQLMITAKLCMVANAIIRDAETNVLSAFNILEGFVPAGFPFFVQQLSCFVLWERGDADPEHVAGNFTVVLDQEELTNARIQVDFVSRRNRSIVNMNGLLVPHPGVLHFRFALDGGAAAEYAVDVERPPAGVAQAQ
jgi:hypothetical protein